MGRRFISLFSWSYNIALRFRTTLQVRKRRREREFVVRSIRARERESNLQL